MNHTMLLGTALCLALSAATVTAAAQDAAPNATQSPAAQPAAPQPKAAPAKVAKAKPLKADAWSGTWAGSLAQVGRAKPFAYMVTLSGKTGRSEYADDHCTGQLVRVGTSGAYAFFTETITNGKLDPASKKGCLDGSLTLVKDASGGLIATWMAARDGKAIVAYGNLAPSK